LQVERKKCRGTGAVETVLAHLPSRKEDPRLTAPEVASCFTTGKRNTIREQAIAETPVCGLRRAPGDALHLTVAEAPAGCEHRLHCGNDETAIFTTDRGNAPGNSRDCTAPFGAVTLFY
jgi:hypothetical protein